MNFQSESNDHIRHTNYRKRVTETKTDRDKQNKKQNDKQYIQKLQKIHRKIIKTQIKKKKS